MGIPIDDGAPAPTDDEPVDPQPEAARPSQDPEIPEADSAEQSQEVSAGWRIGSVSRDAEVSEADAIDQAMEVPAGEDDLDT